MAASLKLCLYHQLQKTLELTKTDLEAVLQEYSDTLWLLLTINSLIDHDSYVPLKVFYNFET